MAGVALALIPRAEFARVEQSAVDTRDALPILADMHRANALATIKNAGSGHLGSTFSSLDIVTWLYHAVMNVRRVGPAAPDRDLYLSSKGHDAPGQYAALYALGILPEARYVRLRRLGGTPGHPDLTVPGVEANTGSLGMGVSKGVGMALAKRQLGRPGRVFVMTGDGEWQEGQIYEALMTAAHCGLSQLTVIVDHNTVQSDRPVADICGLGDLDAKGRAFGWHVERCDGHDVAALDAAMSRCRAVDDRPQVIVADTIKGRGVSFMEHPRALAAGGGSYRWHSGAPDDESFVRADAELMQRVNARLATSRLAPVERRPYPAEAAARPISSADVVAAAFGQTLLDLADRVPALRVLDADLALDCHTRAFELAWPDRFIQAGIAEQDMVSIAGGMARQGLLPVVNSFAAFLTARANEQIANNAAEGARVVYAAHYAGLLPAGPGATHQSVRDISVLAAIPGLTIVQPSCGAEARLVAEFAVCDASSACVIRMNLGASPRAISLPAGYRLISGRGVVIAGTGRAPRAIVSYGPVMLNEALAARDILLGRGLDCDVVNMPWLNRVDDDWLRELAAHERDIVIVEDHAAIGGLADGLVRRALALGLLSRTRWRAFGVDGPCACGTVAEALRFHRLDGDSLARRILGETD